MEIHTIDRIARDLEEKEWDRIVINRGWSVSGPIHVGNLRPDGILPSVVGDVLREQGMEVEELVIVYDQDPFKAKPGQVIWYENPEYALLHKGVPKDYEPSEALVNELKGIRLRDAPDPFECHDSWADHWLDMIHSVLPEFDVNARIVRTSEFYEDKKTYEAFKIFMDKTNRVREIINRYRNIPLSSDWIPINGWCPECKSIADTRTVDVNLQKREVLIKCKKCGWEGWTEFKDSKLNWRLEWATLWYVYDIKLEPYGKDHASAGGSRESCINLAEDILEIEPPFGFWTEWVGIVWDRKDRGDMTSSGNLLMRPDQWLEIAEPEVLRYLYIRHKFTSRIVIDPHNIYRYVNEFDEAEGIYYGTVTDHTYTDKDVAAIKRSYELSVVTPTDESPVRVPYTQAAIIAQVSREENWVEKALRMMNMLESMNITDDLERTILSRIRRANTWIQKYAPDMYVISIVEPSSDFIRNLGEDIHLLEKAYRIIKNATSENELDEGFFALCREMQIKPKRFFRLMYQLYLGKNSGPRLSSFLFAIGKDKSLEVIEKVLSSKN
jgi:lysyl-tRNA synthetase class 1